MATTTQNAAALRRVSGPARTWTAKRTLRTFMLAVVAADVATIGVAILLGSLARARWNIFGEDLTSSWTLQLAVTHGPWIALVWLAWLGLRGAYSKHHFAAGSEEFNRVLVATMLTAGTVAMICYLSKYDLSRGLVAMTFLGGVPLLLGERLAARKILQSLRGRGVAHHRVVLVGDTRVTSHVAAVLGREPQVGYTVVARCVPVNGTATATATSNLGGHRCLERPEAVRDVALANDADAVLITGGGFTEPDDVRRTAWALEGTGVDLIVAPGLAEVAGARVHARPVAGLPLLHIEPPQADEAVRWRKRTFDLVASGILIVVGLPLALGVMAAIKLGDNGPVLFKQRRIGLNGVPFECLKFRTMSPDAESLRDSLLHLNESDGPLFKIRNDPRVTRVGRFLRRYSLDELPQLINVLRGQMSLVGPRPPLPCEVSEYEEAVGRRLLVRPGMTGLWQVSGRSDLSWEDSIRLDLFYVDNWSLFQDLVILLRTARAVLSRRGAL